MIDFKKTGIAILMILAGAWAARADEVKILSGVDLAVETHKWDGKMIRSMFVCFYADVNEFRCVANGRARVDFAKFSNPDPSFQKSIEDNCDTIAHFSSRKCIVTVKFEYESFDNNSMKNDDGTKTFIVILKDGIGAIISSRR
jgi:hypothetical protein